MSDYITIQIGKHSRKYIGMYESIIDRQDADLSSENWIPCVNPKSKTVYVQRVIYVDRKRVTIRLHREILARMLGRELLPTEYTDHINGNGLDNRRENLRLATHQQNMMNRKMQKNNTSGYKGVMKQGNRYRARITVGSRKIFLGSFTTPEMAYQAYCEAAIKYFGEYAKYD